MMIMNEYGYRLQVKSPVVLSPRGSLAFYLSETEQKENNTSYNIIYPFYQYGEYLEYSRESTDYYIPGSSIKGALLAGNVLSKDKKLMVDDIPVKWQDLKLITPLHAKNLNYLNPEKTKLDEQKPSFVKHFENVGLQSLTANSELEGTFRASFDIEEIVKNAGIRAKSRIEEFISQLQEIEKLAKNAKYDDDGKGNFISDLSKAVANLQKLQNKTNLMFLGGNKGLLRSLSVGTADELLWDSGINLDEESFLPFGIVEIVEIVLKERT